MKSNRDKMRIRYTVFLPSVMLVAGAGIVGLINGDTLSRVFGTVFNTSVDWLSWLYQLIVSVCAIVVIVIFFSKKGKIRIGGENAKAKYSFGKWVAMSLTGGIASGIIVYGVSQPIILFENIYGELDGYGIAKRSDEAVLFALGRIFHEWSFVPYSVFALSGVLFAYLCYNKGEKMSVSSSLAPVMSERVTKGFWADGIDFLSIMALVLGLSGSLGAGIQLISAGIVNVYQMDLSIGLLLVVTIAFTVLFLFSAIRGVDKGIQLFANINTCVFLVLLVILFFMGPTRHILTQGISAFGYWIQHLPLWSMDTGVYGGEALVKWWTIMNWAFYIAFAPVTGIFLAQISYGRTIREFLIVNWIIPSVFALVWFSIWGGTAVFWQKNGMVDFVQVIQNGGAMSAMWTFLDTLPATKIFIPVVMITLILSFSTAADSNITTVSSLCVRDAQLGKEAPWYIKLVWGCLCALLAFLMVAFTAGESGLEGIKYMGSVAGLFLLGVVVVQIISAIKLFWF